MSFISLRPNSWVSQESDASPLLRYALQQNPSPLTVSIPGRDAILGSLEFVITNSSTNPVKVESIVFTIQVGTSGLCLTSEPEDIEPVVLDPGWSFAFDSNDSDSGKAVYKLGPLAGKTMSLPSGTAVIIQLNDFPTVTNSGSTAISIVETTLNASEQEVYNYPKFQVTTFPSNFYFRDLIANISNGSQLTPVAQVPNGTQVTLTWNASMADTSQFTIYYSTPLGQRQSSPLTTPGEWVSPPLSCDTVFTVVYTTGGEGGANLTATLSTTVSVPQPVPRNRMADTLICPAGKYQSGLISITGGTLLSCGVLSHADNDSHWFFLSQMSIMEDNTAYIQVLNLGTTDISWNPTFVIWALESTAVTIDTSQIANNYGQIIDPMTFVSLNVVGSASLSGATIGDLLVKSNTWMFTGIQELDPGQEGDWNHYTAPTDGFVVGMVTSPNGFQGESVWAYAMGQTNTIIWQSQGGTVDTPNNSLACIPSTFTMPVKGLQPFSITAIMEGQDIPPDFQCLFYWIPMGAGLAGPAEAIADPGPNFISLPPRSTPPKRNRKTDDFIEALEQLTGKTIDDSLRKKLLRGL